MFITIKSLDIINIYKIDIHTSIYSLINFNVFNYLIIKFFKFFTR